MFRNGHVSTIYSGVMRKVEGVTQKRERITLLDTDFIDLDWSYAGNKTKQLLVVLHGLEGNAQRHYMLGSAKIANQNNMDAVCVNFRGCSGEVNKTFQSYHSGKTDDLASVIKHITSQFDYDTIYLNGFSLGGNVILKYLGETLDLPKQIKAAVTVSVPVYLRGSLEQLMSSKNYVYSKKFLRNLRTKLVEKQHLFPQKINNQDLSAVRTLKDFDDVYTSKAHGFKDAYDYYEQSSSLQYLKHISIPTLLINAQNDSFLSKECYPIQEAEENTNFYLEMPKYGGHVGFYDQQNVYYSEKRMLQFITNL
ncbi:MULTISPECIES: YheT family hydrolase [unclassified Olleya]|jgi:predicted alpha/beta-fold hydrolase|uniref:YheT family hydrolase n=1 Tax=unclassified Olleya TaxID=2615019 RepID=UPI0028F408C5|nr:alpha/beta fold hydrolase [Olleya sp. Hel_I_94]